MQSTLETWLVMNHAVLWFNTLVIKLWQKHLFVFWIRPIHGDQVPARRLWGSHELWIMNGTLIVIHPIPSIKECAPVCAQIQTITKCIHVALTSTSSLSPSIPRSLPLSMGQLEGFLAEWFGFMSLNHIARDFQPAAIHSPNPPTPCHPNCSHPLRCLDHLPPPNLPHPVMHTNLKS